MTGRSDRRTCSNACRKRAARARGTASSGTVRESGTAIAERARAAGLPDYLTDAIADAHPSNPDALIAEWAATIESTAAAAERIRALGYFVYEDGATPDGASA
jgi:hypothetical protein